jgi:hypothetical protein
MGVLSNWFPKKEREYLLYTEEPAPQAEQAPEVGVMKAGELKYSSPFLNLGAGNLTLPYINNTYTGAQGYIRFGKDNLFPQMVNQMYYTSSLNGAIIDFKTNAVSGGGYELVLKDQSEATRARAINFEIKNKIKKLRIPITRDLIQHYRAYALLEFDSGEFKKATRIAPEKVRTNNSKKLYFVCNDWVQNTEIRQIKPYTGKFDEKEKVGQSFFILPYELQCVGQDVYPIPTYSSAFNWMELEGEMSLLHKSNIKNAIFPSFALLFPKKPNGDKEKNAIKNTIEGAKGAPNAGRIFALFANNLDQLPKIEAIPTNQNDKLFEQTDERIDAQVCKAHCIDPLLMGIRVSGKLGSGNDIEKSYIILEKNTILPMRENVEEFFNEILKIARVKAEYKLKNYQIINDAIVEQGTDSTKILENLKSMSPLLANKFLESLTLNEIRTAGGAPRVNGGDKVTTAPAVTAPPSTNTQTGE